MALLRAWWALCFLPLAQPTTMEGCTLTSMLCVNHPHLSKVQFRDYDAEHMLGSGDNEARCLKRAQDVHEECGNPRDMPYIGATYNPTAMSQVYNPGACDEGWHLFGKHCFRWFTNQLNWFQAEKACRTIGKGAHLASIHSKGENDFMFALTGGISAWIGYTDVDQDTQYTWSDNTQNDFNNWSKNCTGLEHTPECAPQEQAAAWHDWEGGDPGTYLCKMPALLPTKLLTNTTAHGVTGVLMQGHRQQALLAVPNAEDPKLKATEPMPPMSGNLLAEKKDKPRLALHTSL